MENTERVPNPEQLQVIENLEDPILLFAGAGTGKTFTVAKRICRILEEGKAQAGEILCLTFTIKAAREMAEDIQKYAGASAKDIHVKTIHSFALELLREESILHPGQYCVPGICDEVDEAELLKKILRGIGLPASSPVLSDDANVDRMLTGFVSKLKHVREEQNVYSDHEEEDIRRIYEYLYRSNKPLFEQMFVFYDKKCHQNRTDPAFRKLMDSSARRFLRLYREALRAANLYDFDDLICEAHHMLRDQETAERWRKRYRYITVDEVQDTTVLEYNMLQKLFPGNHVMLCGDYFQTIYEWRGSQPENIFRHFTEEYRPARYSFRCNYRSTRLLTEAGKRYLEQSFPDRGELYGSGTEEAYTDVEGEKILHILLPTQQQEAMWLYHYLQQNHPEDLSKICILARTNTVISDLYDKLSSIAHEDNSGDKLRFFAVERNQQFYRIPMIKDILAFFHVLENPANQLSLLRLAEGYITAYHTQRDLSSQIKKAGVLGASLYSYMSEDCYLSGDPYAKLLTAFQNGSIVVYDTETTGLDLDRDQMIQLSAIRLDTEGKIAATLNKMILPTVEISPGALATHHVSLEEIRARGGCDAKEALMEFSTFAEGCVLVGHNSLRFDAPLILRQLRECGLPSLPVAAEFDTMMIAKQLYPKNINYKLDTLCKQFNIVNEAAHDALGDITATGKVLYRMITESLLPRAEERIAFFKETSSYFETFYRFVCRLRREYLEQGRLLEMTKLIIEQCIFRKHCKNPKNQEALNELLDALPQENADEPESFLRNFLQDAALSGSQMDVLIRKQQKIPLMTVHQSKGCEFDTVIIVGAEEGQFPLFRAQTSKALQEEARVFYVAITRAKQRLILTNCETKTNGTSIWQVKPSRYLDALPAELVETVHCRSNTY